MVYFVIVYENTGFGYAISLTQDVRRSLYEVCYRQQPRRFSIPHKIVGVFSSLQEAEKVKQALLNWEPSALKSLIEGPGRTVQMG